VLRRTQLSEAKKPLTMRRHPLSSKHRAPVGTDPSKTVDPPVRDGTGGFSVWMQMWRAVQKIKVQQGAPLPPTVLKKSPKENSPPI
jgi:hypothetical protein